MDGSWKSIIYKSSWPVPGNKKNNNQDPIKIYYTQIWKPKHPLINKILPTLKIFNESEEIDSFPNWYRRYLSQYTKEKIYRIDVFEKSVIFDEQGNVKQVSSSLICTLLWWRTNLRRKEL